MASLLNRIQRAMLDGSDEDEVRALLAELAIPAGGSGGSMREIRRGFLRPISDEAILRDALANLGLNGGGTGARPLTRIRSALLHNLIDSETRLWDGLNDLLAPEDLEAGGDGVPEWVPENAMIHIDFVGGDPQGRAWVEGTGEVAVAILLGNDPDVDTAYGDPSEYNSANLTVNGYEPELITAFLGVARTKLLASATVRIVHQNLALQAGTSFPLVLMSADGGDAILIHAGANAINITSYSGSLDLNALDMINDTTSQNAMALTVTGTRIEAVANGYATVAATTFDEFDRPAGNPLTVALFDYRPDFAALQSITIYDPLSSTAGLSDLSEP